MTMPEAFGVYKGICTNNADPEGLNRIKAICPQVFGDPSTQTDWALPAFPPGGAALPAPTQGVWLAFEGGDVNYPIWFGVWAGHAGQTVIGVPIGGVIEWYSSTLPVGAGTWLILDGSMITATAFPLLAAVYPNWVVAGNITLPDTRDKVTVGAGNLYTPGQTGGSANVTLVATNIPEFVDVGVSFSGQTSIETAAHTHNLNTGSLLGLVTEQASTENLQVSGSGLQATASFGLSYTTGDEEQNHTHNMTGVSGTVTFGSASPTSISTIQPFVAAYKIVRAA